MDSVGALILLGLVLVAIYLYLTWYKEKTKADLTAYVFEKQTFDYEITKFKDSLNNRTVIPKIEINSNGTYRILNLSVLKLLTQIISE